MKENNNLSLSDLDDSIILRENESLLNLLLKDHTTGKNIKWGTDSYINHGYSFRDDQEIKIDLITGWYEGFIRPRVDKDIDIQLKRQRNKAEVFTPSWVIKLQVDAALEDMKELSLVDFIKTKWLEITCGEAPYMVNRYDMETGEVIPLKDRAGFIDDKFKKINEAIDSEEEWLKLAVEIYKASYGYEYQGDSLLLARENLILTFIDNYFYMFGAFPKDKILLEITNIVGHNVFQMDGLTYEVPYSVGALEDNGTQLSLFEEVEEVENTTSELAKIKLWNKNKIVEVKKISERNEKNMKFDVVLGNPPYQKPSDVNNRQQPIYHHFYDSAKKIGTKYCLITPARFLFNAGLTPKPWNLKMLNDKHLEVMYYNANSAEIFPNTDIKGGVAVLYRDSTKEKEPIKQFTPDENLRNIANRFGLNAEKHLTSIMYGGRSALKFNETFLEKYPKSKNDRLKYIQKTRPTVKVLSKNEEYEIKSSTFESLEYVFTENKPHDTTLFYRILGLYGTARTWRWIERKYLEPRKLENNIEKYKVFIPKANGSGDFGEILSQPVVGRPGDSSTPTFISIGKFDSEIEAENCSKYLRTKLLRSLLGILKITQDNPPYKWAYIPIQDFTAESDIDWSKSISEIDQQLYKKYSLNQEDINFIETNVKEME